jgi:hypothetical protein
MTTTILKQLTCFRCGYQWWPKSEKKPDRCAKCNSPYWDRPRRAESVESGQAALEKWRANRKPIPKHKDRSKG